MNVKYNALMPYFVALYKDTTGVKGMHFTFVT